MNELLFGTAGVPLSANLRSTAEGIARVRKLGLGCMEMEFVHGVKMGPETSIHVHEQAIKHNIVLTAHGPYYINLNSLEKAKRDASVNRILETARVAARCGAYSITFHAAYYMGAPKEKVYAAVKEHLQNIVSILRKEGVDDIWIRPETTGKGTQFGDIDEIIRLSKEIENVMPCVDFSHLHARSNGQINSLKEFSHVLEMIESGLGREALNNMHIHLSGIAYSAKGEKNHLELENSDMNYKDLMKAFRDFRCKGVVISESPNIEEDALRMKKEFEKG